jgi:hypothetical protein
MRQSGHPVLGIFAKKEISKLPVLLISAKQFNFMQE